MCVCVCKRERGSTCFVLIRSFFGGQLCYFHFGTILNNAAVNLYAPVFTWPYVFSSLGYRNEIAGSYGN